MRVLVLSPYPTAIIETLRVAGDLAIAMDGRVGIAMLQRLEIDWIVSYGYRHLIGEPVFGACRDRSINLHISLLPFNRGADPNFWSWFDGTPKGVTIHEIDAGLDTGPVFAQREVAFLADDTLATSYDRLRAEMENLFNQSWIAIRDGDCKPAPQAGRGTSHRRADKAAFFDALPRAYETPVRVIEAQGAAARKAAGLPGASGERR